MSGRRGVDRVALRAALGEIAAGDLPAAAARLGAVEWDLFKTGDGSMGEVGYARWRLIGGDVDGATRTLQRLADGGGP